MEASKAGWQYLIADGQGYAVIDLSSSITGSFSRVRRGRFAEAYHDALAAMERDGAAREEGLIVEVLEIPAAFTATVVMRGASIDLYPVSIRGERPARDRMSLDEFVAAAATQRISGATTDTL